MSLVENLAWAGLTFGTTAGVYFGARSLLSRPSVQAWLTPRRVVWCMFIGGFMLGASMLWVVLQAVALVRAR